MILTRDFCSYFFLPLCGTHKYQSQAGGIGQETLQRQPTALNNKLVVLHIDDDLKMKLWRCCSRWVRLVFKSPRLPLQLGSNPGGIPQSEDRVPVIMSTTTSIEMRT